jgi:hypothetical protein
MEAKPIVREMNRLPVIPSAGLSIWQILAAAGLALGTELVIWVLVGFLTGLLPTLLVFLGTCWASRWMNRHEPKFLDLLFLTPKSGDELDPALREDADGFPEIG